MSMRYSTFLILIILAALLRFYHLGTWSFGFDELFTTLEAKILFGETPISNELLPNNVILEETQYYRLSRLLCVSHAVHRLDYLLFGENEWGARVLPAIIGSLNVGIIFLLAQPLFGNKTAFILALLVLLLPEHIQNSQLNRFYIQSFFFVSVVLLLGNHVAVNHSRTAAFWLGPAAILMVLSNSFGGIIWAGLLAGLFANFLFAKNSCNNNDNNSRCKNSFRNIKSIVFLLIVWSVLLFGIFIFHIVPLSVSWNDSSSWGYTPLHSAMAFVNSFGWTSMLFSFLGIWLLVVRFRTAANLYWLTLIFVSIISVLLLPLKIIYNPFYSFIFTFPFIVTTAIFLREIHQLVRESAMPYRSIVAEIWIFVAILVNVPVLLSYYQDGNRPDLRAAYQYVAEHWENGDQLTGFLMGAAEHYIPDKVPRIPLSPNNTAEKLQTILDQKLDDNHRLWIVLTSSRGGLDQNLRRWLSRHALFEIQFCKRRFDYSENSAEVFLIPKLSDQKHNTVRKTNSKPCEQ